jgi:hypothetical protein
MAVACLLLYPLYREEQLDLPGSGPQVKINIVVGKFKADCALEAAPLSTPGIGAMTDMFYGNAHRAANTVQGQITGQNSSLVIVFRKPGADECRLRKLVDFQELFTTQMLVAFGMV